jgi:hypothetical protein
VQQNTDTPFTVLSQGNGVSIDANTPPSPVSSNAAPVLNAGDNNQGSSPPTPPAAIVNNGNNVQQNPNVLVGSSTSAVDSSANAQQLQNAEAPASVPANEPTGNGSSAPLILDESDAGLTSSSQTSHAMNASLLAICLILSWIFTV